MCDVNGETLAISSYAWGTTGIFYRKSMLEDAGVDPESIKTQEDFREACAKFTKDGKYAMGVVSGTHAFTVSEWSRLIARPVSGGLYFPNGESEPYTADNVNVNAPENVWAAQWWQDFILKDKAAKLVTDKKDSREMFWNGEVPFNMDGPWFVGMSKERDESLMDDIGIIPQFDVTYEGETYKPNPTNYPLVTMISKNCEHPDEAYAFLEWMTTDEAQALIADCGMIPSNTDYSTSDEYIKNHELEYAIVGFMQNNYAELIADPNIAQLGRDLPGNAGCGAEDVLRAGGGRTDRDG
ncbi:MAG: extracellular solute-binding protein [[Clostridium] scindens]